jgi:endonuclease/exonuclease/phosphatase family metal-dependent hydrolase
MDSVLGIIYIKAMVAVAYIALPRRVPPVPKRTPSSGQGITLLSSNAYLIPWFYVYKLLLEGDKFAINSCKDQHKRAKLLADMGKHHDILAFQEIWGGGTDVLQREIESTHAIVPVYRQWSGIANTGLLGDYVNTVISHIRSLGGLWFATCPSLSVVWSLHHTFAHKEGEEFMNKSASFLLLDVSSKWGPGRKLLVINTHLHSPEPFDNTKDRRAQRKEISAILSSLPERLKLEGVDVEWSKCGAILVGDLNTAFCVRYDRSGRDTTEEYHETLKEFDAVDLYLHNDAFQEEHRAKYSYDAATNELISEVVRKDSSRMDYALALSSLSQGAVRLMPLRASKCQIVNEQTTPSSDHWPLSVELFPA